MKRKLQLELDLTSRRTFAKQMVLGLIFIGLKLTHLIDWNWLWVLCPIWIPISFAIIILLLTLIFGKADEDEED